MAPIAPQNGSTIVTFARAAMMRSSWEGEGGGGDFPGHRGLPECGRDGRRPSIGESIGFLAGGAADRHRWLPFLPELEDLRGGLAVTRQALRVPRLAALVPDRLDSRGTDGLAVGECIRLDLGLQAVDVGGRRLRFVGELGFDVGQAVFDFRWKHLVDQRLLLRLHSFALGVEFGQAIQLLGNRQHVSSSVDLPWGVLFAATEYPTARRFPPAGTPRRGSAFICPGSPSLPPP